MTAAHDIRRDSATTTIARLRQELQATQDASSSSQTALAKSDAVILELRSSVRQLKRQLDDQHNHHQVVQQAESEQLRNNNNNHNNNNNPPSSSLPDNNYYNYSDAKDARVGELQVQLDRAHAQILTADMVRKELEDTLEAEQYTWELRVQDQERTILQLQQECAALAEELEQCRQQWKDAEQGGAKELQELQVQLEKVQQEAQHWKSMQQQDHNNSQQGGGENLKERLFTLEQQRTELQNCLDEALKELEAVDAELQQGGSGQIRQENKRLHEMLQQQEGQLMEPLQHLYRWLLERDGVEESASTKPRDARELIAAIQSHLERIPQGDQDVSALKNQVAVLESQLSVYKGDLKAREESSAELRASLKEAVSLLKPLQDAVAKGDREKARMQERIDRLQAQAVAGASDKGSVMKTLRKNLREKEDEIERLQEEIESLELQLSRAKLAAANSVLDAQKSPGSHASSESLTKTREELRAKRAAEQSLKKLLRDAQSRFRTFHKQQEEERALNTESNDHSKDTADIGDGKSVDSADLIGTMQRTIENRDTMLRDIESATKVLKGELAKKDVELRAMSNQLLQVKSDAGDHGSDKRMFDLDAKLASASRQLAQKKEVEKALNKSLKEALGLLKPLQMHLEEAEQEKRDMAKEMRGLRQRLNESEQTESRSSEVHGDAAAIRDLENMMRQLELENSQLHNALEDMSQSLNASNLTGTTTKGETQLREELVEMKSRYEVTKGRLEDAYVENKTLVEGLKKRDHEESDMVGELEVLRAKLMSAEDELENAKYIATSALVKVEELTMANVEQLSLNSADHESAYREKALKAFDKEMTKQRSRSRHPY